jgi:hypothetical protein
MQVLLDRFAAGLAPGAHAALLLAPAGWYTARDIAVPANVGLVHLPPYSPNLNPAERIWLCLCASDSSRTGSSPISTPSSPDAATPGTAVAEPGRIASLTDDPYLDRRPIPAVGQDFTRRA